MKEGCWYIFKHKKIYRSWSGGPLLMSIMPFKVIKITDDAIAIETIEGKIEVNWQGEKIQWGEDEYTLTNDFEEYASVDKTQEMISLVSMIRDRMSNGLNSLAIMDLETYIQKRIKEAKEVSK